MHKPAAFSIIGGSGFRSQFFLRIAQALPDQFRVAGYVKGGPSFYGLPDAAQDHYLGMLIEQAIQSGDTVRAVRQPWAN